MEEKEDAEARQDRGWGGHLWCVRRDGRSIITKNEQRLWPFRLGTVDRDNKGLLFGFGKKYEHISHLTSHICGVR